MDLRALAISMAAYNRWMNDKIYALAGELTDEQRKRDLGAFFKSIHGTLNHILVADEAWLQRLARLPVTLRPPDHELFSEFGELRQARRAMDEKLGAWAAALDEQTLGPTLDFYSGVYKRNRSIPYWAAVVHTFNHQTHHRGQVATLLKQLGKDPGPTDFPWMPFFDQ